MAGDSKSSPGDRDESRRGERGFHRGTGVAASPRRACRPSTTSASPTGPAGPCQTTELPVPSGMKDRKAVAVDPTGKYVGGTSTVGQDFRPILWTDGQSQALPVPGRSFQLTAVNASGVVVGLLGNTMSGEGYVFRYETGAYTRLHTPPGSWRPYLWPRINEAGGVINVEPRGNSEGEGSSTAAVEPPLPGGPTPTTSGTTARSSARCTRTATRPPRMSGTSRATAGGWRCRTATLPPPTTGRRGDRRLGAVHA